MSTSLPALKYARCHRGRVRLRSFFHNGANNWLRTLKTDAWGHVLQERRGNSTALEVNRSYFAENGRVQEICESPRVS